MSVVYSEWRCRALVISPSDWREPTPFDPSWTVIFNSAFASSESWVDRSAFETGKKVDEWIATNASARMLAYDTGEILCESETDANLLFLTFR